MVYLSSRKDIYITNNPSCARFARAADNIGKLTRA